MKRFFFWARRHPLQWTGVVIVLVTLVEFLFWGAFGWDFNWNNVVNITITASIVGFAGWSWRKYEQENNVTTTLYKDRKKVRSSSTGG